MLSTVPGIEETEKARPKSLMVLLMSLTLLIFTQKKKQMNKQTNSEMRVISTTKKINKMIE